MGRLPRTDMGPTVSRFRCAVYTDCRPHRTHCTCGCSFIDCCNTLACSMAPGRSGLRARMPPPEVMSGLLRRLCPLCNEHRQCT